MIKRWVDASNLETRNASGDPRDVAFSAHPMLDPEFARRPSRARRFFQQMYFRIRDDDAAYRAEIKRMLNPPLSDDGAVRESTELIRYLTEAETYVRDLVALLPASSREHASPDARISACNDMRTLMSFLFSADDPRVSYEAQRKLYLAKLLLDIDHSRQIQLGPKHKAHFERMLRKGLWEYALDTNAIEIGFHIDEDGETIRFNLRPRPGQERFAFKTIFLEKQVGKRKIPLDVLYYNCRFKRTVVPISYEIVDGSHRVIERKRWDATGTRSSGSILSKMIRKGINDPDEISDILGAMFIVHDEDAINDLLTLLDSVFGSPISWQDVTDTLIDSRDGRHLDRHSGRGYRVYKGDLGILHPSDIPGGLPYRFRVEVQIYALEGFLRTVHGAHDASHLALKLRQFLHGLVPIVFPRAVYGEDWLRLP